MQHRVVTDYSNVKGNETVKVFVRLRPPEDGSNVSKQHIKDLDKNNKITILDPRDQTSHTGNEHTFAFNEVFNVETDQESIFSQTAEPLVTQTFKIVVIHCKLLLMLLQLYMLLSIITKKEKQ